jgi:hypothetical protein
MADFTKLFLGLILSSAAWAQGFPFPGVHAANRGGVSLVAHTDSGTIGGGIGFVTSSGQNVVSGNMVACSVRYTQSAGGVVLSVTDTGSTNTFTLANRFNFGSSGSQGLEVWIAYNTIAQTSDIFTANMSVTTGFQAIACDQFSGIITTGNPTDQVAAGTISGSGLTTSATFTPSQAHELFYAALDASGSTSGNWTVGACGTGTCTFGSDMSSTIGVALATEWWYLDGWVPTQAMAATSNSGGDSAINVVTFKVH